MAEEILLFTKRQNTNAAIVQLLIEKGSTVTALNIINETPLHNAARQNVNPEVVGLNMTSDALLNQTDLNEMMHDAAINPNPEVIDLFLKQGASVSHVSERGDTVLHDAALQKIILCCNSGSIDMQFSAAGESHDQGPFLFIIQIKCKINSVGRKSMKLFLLFHFTFK